MAFTTGEKMTNDENVVKFIYKGADGTITPVRLLKFVSKEEFMKEEFQSPDILTYKLEEEDKINAENT